MSEENRLACDLLVKNVRVFDGTTLRKDLSIGITGTKISCVANSAGKAIQEIDARGRFLMPGLIDCHIHLLNMWTAKDEATMAADIANELPKRLNAFLAAGVTTVKSVGDSEDDVLRVRQMLASGALVGPRLYATGPAFAAPDSHPATTVVGQNPWLRNRTVVETDSPQKAREAVKRLAEKKVDAIKIVHEGGCRHGAPYFMKIDVLGVNVQILRLEKAVLEAIIDEAHKHGLKATVHTVNEEAAIEALEAGANGLEHGILEHEMSGDRVIELLLRNEASYVPTLWLLAVDEKPAEARYGNLKRVANSGVRVALGTDSFCGFGSFGENTIVEAERSVAAGIAPQKVLEMATKNAGLHLGNDALGMIAPGRIADLIIVDGDPTTNIGDLRNVAMVIKDGKIQIDKMRKD
jgi:imidazolonepropionase-like amidohydrolase